MLTPKGITMPTNEVRAPTGSTINQATIEVKVRTRSPFMWLAKGIVWIVAPFVYDHEAWGDRVAGWASLVTWVKVHDGRWIRARRFGETRDSDTEES